MKHNFHRIGYLLYSYIYTTAVTNIYLSFLELNLKLSTFPTQCIKCVNSAEQHFSKYHLHRRNGRTVNLKGRAKRSAIK